MSIILHVQVAGLPLREHREHLCRNPAAVGRGVVLHFLPNNEARGAAAAFNSFGSVLVVVFQETLESCFFAVVF